jgi:hypothetical protein
LDALDDFRLTPLDDRREGQGRAARIIQPVFPSHRGCRFDQVPHDIPPLRGTPNARFQPPLEAGATQERTLEAVGCKSLFGGVSMDSVPLIARSAASLRYPSGLQEQSKPFARDKLDLVSLC